MESPRVRRLGAVSLLALISPQFASADPTFDFYGQFNFGIFSVDDGTESETYVTDNDNSNSRIGFIYANELSADRTLKFHFETALGFEGSAAATMDDHDTDIDMSRTELRKLELIYETANHGTFYLGQGSTATDGVAEVDFSGTSVVTYSSVGDLAGSFQFRPQGGALSGTDVGDAFANFDGARRARVRYDTPSFNGFSGSLSYGVEELNRADDREFTDIAVKYAQDYGDLKIEGRLGYQWIDDDAGDEEVLLGSIAVLHKPTGLNFALSSAGQDNGDADYIYAKLGLQRDWFSIGSTSLAVDIYEGSDFVSAGSDSTSYAVSAVQRLDRYNMEVYASYRSYEFDATGTNYEDIDVMVLGARWKF